ncbi:MAG: hypothetical protein RBR54_07600 [Sulfurimonas sp.]|jgi:tetratricopeptide (TPR) repeat protein|nr:hypothetical protein [Sulfurimonas sp.]
MKKLLLIPLIISLSLTLLEAKKQSDEIDHIALAALLLRDGHIDKADAALESVDLEDTSIDLMRYHTLKALVALKQGLYAESNKHFLLSFKEGQEDKTIFLYMAQNSFKLQKYKEALGYLDAAAELSKEKASLYSLRAEIHWRLDEQEKALGVLQEAMQRFNNEYTLLKQRFFYFISLGLYQSALNDAHIYLNHAQLDEKSALVFINAFKKAEQLDDAIALAEELLLKFDQSAKLTALLAYLYIDKGMLQSAADLFDKASIKDTQYTKESAELYRRAKNFVLSLYKNSQLLDTQEKLKQRIAIYLEYKAYEKVVVSRNALERSGLLKDENIRYALAYSYYMVGEFDKCERELKKLTKSELFTKATELRKNIQKCKNDGWECEL